jgi:hypothetical protein
MEDRELGLPPDDVTGKGAPASVDARILRMAGPNLADPSRPRAMYRPSTKCVPGQTSIGELLLVNFAWLGQLLGGSDTRLRSD